LKAADCSVLPIIPESLRCHWPSPLRSDQKNLHRRPRWRVSAELMLGRSVIKLAKGPAARRFPPPHRAGQHVHQLSTSHWLEHVRRRPLAATSAVEGSPPKPSGKGYETPRILRHPHQQNWIAGTARTLPKKPRRHQKGKRIEHASRYRSSRCERHSRCHSSFEDELVQGISCPRAPLQLFQHEVMSSA